MSIRTLHAAEALARDDLILAVARLRAFASELERFSAAIDEHVLSIPDEVWSSDSRADVMRSANAVRTTVRGVRAAVLEAASAVAVFTSSGSQALEDSRRAVKRLHDKHDKSAFEKLRGAVNVFSNDASDASHFAAIEDAFQTAQRVTLQASQQLEGALRSLRIATGRLLAPPTGVSSESALEEIGANFAGVASMLSGTPSTAAYAAALFLDETENTRNLIARRVEQGLISQLMLAEIRSIAIDRLADAQVLNRRISDWPSGSDIADRRLHGVFVDLPVFDGEPKITDISQGEVGDCWLLAALGAIVTHDPGALKRLIRDNYDGTFTVLFADGRDVTVSADMWAKDWAGVETDYTNDVSNLKMAQANEDGGAAQWPWIIEKAFAARRGAFGADDEPDESSGINGGYTTDAVFTLLGWDAYYAPRTTDRHDFGDRLPITVSLGKGEFYHAYTYLGRSVDDKGRERIALFNPWGDDALHEDLDLKILLDSRDDGVFYVDAKDFDKKVPIDRFVLVRPNSFSPQGGGE